MSNVINWSKAAIGHIEGDLGSFKDVVANPGLPGKLCISMIATAMAAFDAYAFVLFQGNPKLNNNQLFAKLINDARFFDKAKYWDERVFYKQIRCGVAHQIYPKAAGMVALKTNTVLYQHNGELCVNALALLEDVLRGIKAIHAHFEQASTQELATYEANYANRVLEDQFERAAISIGSSGLPSLN